MSSGPAWTILIATLGARRSQLAHLLSQLLPQVTGAAGQVTVSALWNNGERPLCEVRQDLLDHATADYVCFVDDDDEVPPYYVSRVLPLLEDGPDYVGWRMQSYLDGVPQAPTFHSLRYTAWSSDADGHYRDISHLNPVRRELTAGTRYCAGWPEDRVWAAQMRGRLATEVFIEDDMYFYLYWNANSVQRGTAIAPAAGRRLDVDCPWFSWHPASTP